MRYQPNDIKGGEIIPRRHVDLVGSRILRLFLQPRDKQVEIAGEDGLLFPQGGFRKRMREQFAHAGMIDVVRIYCPSIPYRSMRQNV